MNGLNSFERTVKDSLEPYEVPYNSADWAQLERSLGQGTGTGRIKRSGLYALLIGGSIAVASSVYVVDAPYQATAANVGSPATKTMPSTRIEDAPMAENQVAEEGNDQGLQPLENSTGDVVKEGGPTPINTTNTIASTTEVVAAIERPVVSESPVVRPSITEGCPGTLIEFAVENLPEEGIYLWNFGDGSFSNKPAPNHAFSKSGSFEVMLSHSSPGGGNIHNKPAADRIIIHEAPEASFNLLKQEYDNTVPSVHFENRSLGGKSYSWDFGDGTTTAIAHPDHVYKKAGVYQVALTVTNANGCIDRTERTIRIDTDYDLLSPKTFSPNADGVDDVFMPEALKSLGVKFHLSIFDSKSGQLVYETGDAQRPWNGRLANRNEPCVPGDYVWMVEMKDGDKLGGTYNGSVNLMR